MTKVHNFTVTGTLGFPLDMLRYDRCWPMSETLTAMHASCQYPARSDGPFIVKLQGHRAPTLARWASFGYVVSDHGVF